MTRLHRHFRQYSHDPSDGIPHVFDALCASRNPAVDPRRLAGRQRLRSRQRIAGGAAGVADHLHVASEVPDSVPVRRRRDGAAGRSRDPAVRLDRPRPALAACPVRRAGRRTLHVRGDRRRGILVRGPHRQRPGATASRRDRRNPACRSSSIRPFRNSIFASAKSQPGEIELTWRATDEHLDIEFAQARISRSGDDRLAGGQHHAGRIGARPRGQCLAAVACSSARRSRTRPETPRTPKHRPANRRRSGAARRAAATNDEARFPPAGRRTEPATPTPDDSLAFDEAAGRHPQRQRRVFPTVAANARADGFRSRHAGPSAVRLSRRSSSRRQKPSARTQLEPPSRTAGIATRYVRARAFNVQYELDDVGPSGVSSVDLYITENNGSSGSTTDRMKTVEARSRSKCRATAVRLRLRVRSGAGLVRIPPQPGDPPTFVVVVDRKPPQAELGKITQGQGAGRGEVTIEWTGPRRTARRQTSAAELGAGPRRPVAGDDRLDRQHRSTSVARR